MNILFSIVFKINLKMKSQIFFAWFLVLQRIGLVPNVYCKQGLKIEGSTSYSTPYSKFHSVNYSNVQLFLLLDQGKRTLILKFDVYICFPFVSGNIHNRPIQIPNYRPCNSHLHVSKRQQLHIHNHPLEKSHTCLGCPLHE